MGMMICEKHGRQSMAFTSPLIAAAIDNPSAARSINCVHRISIPFLEVWGDYLVDNIFVEENEISLPIDIDLKGEGWAEKVFEKLMPVCKQCLGNLQSMKLWPLE
ncbi:MAG: hypothetical protein V4645_06000 [Pseudomonadota bacterium]